MRRLLHARRHKRLAGSRTFLALYSTALFILVTIDISANAVWGEELWISSRSKPGGIPEFIATQISVWYETLGSTSVVAMIFMGDALLVSPFCDDGLRVKSYSGSASVSPNNVLIHVVLSSCADLPAFHHL